MSETNRTSDVIWRGPLVDLTDTYRELSATAERIPGGETAARLYREVARQIEDAIEEARKPEWIRADALLDVMPDLKPATLRSRCRREWKVAGLARKFGEHWYVHRALLSHDNPAAA